MRQDTEPWLRQATADLETSDVLLRAGRYYAVSWFVQQSVEKGLKALYIERRGILAPRTHDLRFLATEVALPAEYLADITLINPAFDLTRYPDSDAGSAPVDVVTPERAALHRAAAGRIFQWLVQQINRM